MFKNASRTVVGLWPGVVLAAALFSNTAGAQYTATVDLNTRYQTFEGWGTSLAWWANVVGGYPDANRNDYVTQFFDPVSGAWVEHRAVQHWGWRESCLSSPE